MCSHVRPTNRSTPTKHFRPFSPPHSFPHGMLGFGLTMPFPAMDEDASHLAAFHAGERAALERCYRDHYASVAAAARRILRPVDAETVTHEVFHRLLASAEMRATFRGGDLGAWLSRVTTNRAIDHKRRYAREEPLSPTLPVVDPHTESDDSDRLAPGSSWSAFARSACLRNGSPCSRRGS